MTPSDRILLSLLSNNDVTFFIPPFQRNYEWTNEQCDVFWRDIDVTARRNLAGERSEHFFGTVTYYQTDSTFGEPNILVLVDGQQRITTTMLFLAALRDTCGDAKKANLIDNKYLKNQNSSGEKDEFKVKLKQVETDWPAFKKLILAEPLSEVERVSAVYSNYQFFKDKIVEVQKEGRDPFSLVEKGLALFRVITIELKPAENTWENPQEIFESMNSIGKPLSLADLVRNHLLYGESPKQQEELYRKYWLVMERSVPNKVSAFMRDFMQLHAKCPFPVASEANHKRLYHDFKRLFDDHETASLLQELSDYARIYALILGSNSGEKVIYENHAGLQIARDMITSCEKWDAEAISLRANWMIGLLVNSILPIPDEMRTANNYNVRKQVKSKSLSFEEMGLIGEEITFVDDSDIVAKVVGDTEVEFEGKRMKLAPLTREIKIRQGRCNKSGAYQGAQYWKYEDTRLAELM